MLIKFICPQGHIRLVEEYRWARENDWVQDVPGSLVLTLMTQPGENFQIDGNDPLLRAVGRQATEQLVLAGVYSLAELTGLSKPRGRQVASQAGVTGKTLLGWIEAAERALKSGMAADVPLVDVRGCCGD